ncbi:MAG: relaxase/mobilization nuclease domain-containing protein [Coriobacteriaceae bacterium]|nr:relaxase/mobilization nuclease domain-containing protein [Coriobacteriaceae bacterium]MCI6843341.1 relaxase/mobilization nuclease domain-containing protein [Coriobacteriaceae bacterium]
MSFLKTKSCHGSAFHVWRYLTHGPDGKGDRQVAFDSNFAGPRDEWWRELDATCHAMGHDRGTPRGRARTYVHYVISPSADDLARIGPEETLRRVRLVATGFAGEFLAGHEWAVVYHDDNASHIPHAHVVAGVSDLATGRKLSESDAQLARARGIVDRLSRAQGLEALADRVDGTGELLERENEARASRGEARVPRTPRTGRRETAQPRVRSFAERHMAGRSWKSELRQAADECAASADSFAAFADRMRQRGLDAYVNRRGQVVYVWADGTRRVAGDRLGLGYQTDFLACRFLDLRFTRAAWAAQRGQWSVVRATGVRTRRVDWRDMERLAEVARRSGAIGGADLAAHLSAARSEAGRARNGAEAADRAVAALERDLEDARLVESLRDTVEPSRVGGRLVGVPLEAGVLRDYEAARKRLARRDYPTGSVSDVKLALAAMRANAGRARDALASAESTLSDLNWACSTEAALRGELEEGASAEAARYGMRLRTALDAPVYGSVGPVSRPDAGTHPSARPAWAAGDGAPGPRAPQRDGEAAAVAEGEGPTRSAAASAPPQAWEPAEAPGEAVTLGPDAVADRADALRQAAAAATERPERHRGGHGGDARSGAGEPRAARGDGRGSPAAQGR